MNKNELKFEDIATMNNRDFESREIVVEFTPSRSIEYVDDNVTLGRNPEPRITGAKILKMRRKPARRYGDLSLDIFVVTADNSKVIKTYITKFDMTECLYNRTEPDVKVYEIS